MVFSMMQMNYVKLVVGLGVLALGTAAISKLRARSTADANQNALSKTALLVPQDAVLGKSFVVGIQESALLARRLKVTFEKVMEDSRCPQDVDCVWSGQATISVRLEEAGRELGTANLTVQGSRHTTETSIRQVGPYWIKLIEVAPGRGPQKSPDTIQRITLLVQSKPIPAPKNGK